MNKKTKEIFVSIDIETDGPSPVLNSMLSFGAYAIDINKKTYGSFSRNLTLYPGAKQDERTMKEFWSKFPDIYDEARKNTVHPSQAMEEFAKFINGVKDHGKVVFLAYPLGFDYKFMDFYMNKYLGKNLFGISGLDIKSYAMATNNTEFSHTAKRNFPKEWFSSNLPHTHLAIDDAIEQGHLFINILRYRQGLPAI